MATLLNRAARALKRLHATNSRNIPNILAQGELRPFSHPLDTSQPVVFTSASPKHTYFDPEYTGRNSMIHYSIPKQWHREHVVENPHYVGRKVQKDPNWSQSYQANDLDRKAFDVMNGGRTTTYDAPIPNEFVDEICFGSGLEKCYDPKVLKERIINESPDINDNLWDWNYDEDPTYDDFFELYGRHR